jgi:hypothetical protein
MRALPLIGFQTYPFQRSLIRRRIRLEREQKTLLGMLCFSSAPCYTLQEKTTTEAH